MMETTDYIPHLLIAFFIISNTVAFYNIYKNRLRYLNPSKGYLFSLLLIVVFVAFDYSVYSFATQSSSTTSKRNYTRFYIENSLNKLADAEILDQDKDLLVEDLRKVFATQEGKVSVKYQHNAERFNGNTELHIEDYLQQLRFSKQTSVIKVQELKTDKLGQIHYLQVSM